MVGVKDEALDGWWWLPGCHDHARFGRLSAGASGSWTLDLYGGPERDEAVSASVLRRGGEVPTAPVIQGHLLHGVPGRRFVSLLDCWRTSARQTFGGIAHEERTESWTFEEIVCGDDNVSGDERLTEIRVRLSSLLEWSGRQRPGVHRSDRAATVSTTSIDLGSAHVPDATVDLVLDHSAAESAAEATIRHQAMFRVAPNDAVSFQTAMSVFALPLRALLSFMTLGQVDVEQLAVRLEAHQNDRWSMWFDYRTRLQRPFEEPKRPGRHEMLATWPDLEDMTVQGLVGGWFEVHRQMEKAITLLLVPHHAPYLYTDDHLMTAFVAAEAYHAARIGGIAIDPQEHDERVDAIVDAAPVEYRAWANEMLRGKNQKGQRRKLKDIVERAGTTGESLLTAAPGFVDLAVKRRGSVAHPTTSARAPGAEYLAVSYGLRWMLRHCLLVDLGLSQERAAELIAACKRFSDELALVRRWTAGS
jgi:hypothetical protein